MSTSAVLEKIKKLLRLARSANQHEAALAMERAMALAAEHRVEIDGLNLDESTPNITHRDTEALARMPYDRTFASFICKRFFRVRVIERGAVRVVDGWPKAARKLAFVGTASDVEIALYVYEFLYRHFAYCWRKHRGRCRNRYAFVQGMYEGLYSKLAQAEPPAPLRQTKGTELQLSLDAYIDLHFGKTTSHGMASGTASTARWRGYIQGRNTQIAPAVKAGEPSPLALK